MEKYDENKDYSSTTTTVVKEENVLWSKVKSLWNNHKGKIITGVVLGVVGYVAYKHVQIGKLQKELTDVKEISELIQMENDELTMDLLSAKDLLVSPVGDAISNASNELVFQMEDGRMLKNVDDLITGLKPEIIGNDAYYSITGITKIFEDTKNGLIETDVMNPAEAVMLIRTNAA